MLTPYAALPGFDVDSDTWEIAGHYDMTGRRLKFALHANDAVWQARDALYWKLTTQRGLSPEDVARAVPKCDPADVRAGAASHAARIANFRAGAHRA